MLKKGRQSGWLLWIGYGGLLGLLAGAGLYGWSTTRQIGARNEQIRRQYLDRELILQQLRSDVYLTGTHARSVLLESDDADAELDRKSFAEARDRTSARLHDYTQLSLTQGHAISDRFATEYKRYIQQLTSALNWSVGQRKTAGLTFMKEVLLPGRTLLVQQVDQLSLANARQLEAGSREITGLFTRFNRNLISLTIGSLVIGLGLAAFTARRLLRLERIAQHQLHELQDLSSRLVQVQESERRAISRELHDEVGQAVSGLLLGIGNIAAGLSPEHNAAAREQLSDLRLLAERTVASVRNLSLLLRPSMLDDLGLVPALQWQAREVSRVANISVQVSAVDFSDAGISEEAKTCIYRVVQEALQNVVRHARANSVDISLEGQPGRGLTLRIVDNGRGFRPQEKGLGILGMEERVRHQRGVFQIDSVPGRGTTLLIQLPA